MRKPIVAGIWLVAAAFLIPPGRAEPGPGGASPYDPRPDHLWNRVHRALFVRLGRDGRGSTHVLDPLIWTDSKYLLRGPSHAEALAVLDEFLRLRGERLIDDPTRRALLQRDLWAVFDHSAWIADDRVHFSKDEPAARALRLRVAEAISRLAPTAEEAAALPDTYARTAASGDFAAEADPDHPARPFLPPDLFREDGPWVRYGAGLAPRHTKAVSARSAFHVFLRLPGGRATTLDYIEHLKRDPPRFPVGTAVALVRRALVVDRRGRVVPTPLIESVQLRVYREVPPGDGSDHRTLFARQDVSEFVLSRPDLFAGGPGLRPVGRDEIAESESFPEPLGDTFEVPSTPVFLGGMRILDRCIQCHQRPGVHSVLSIGAVLDGPDGGEREPIRRDSLDVDKDVTVHKKHGQYDWGLLQGLFEGLSAPPSE